MRHPSIGMRYNDALKTAIRHMNEGSEDIVVSMARQVQRHEGIKAAEEFCREVEAKSNENKKIQYFV